MQVTSLHQKINRLHKKHGDTSLAPIYGAGCASRPNVMFLFMNPTGRNVSAQKKWNGLRAPWLGTKNVWKVFWNLGLLSRDLFEKTQALKTDAWTEDFAEALYAELHRRKIFVTNLAKCTQPDARPLKNKVFKDFLGVMHEEIAAVRPKVIVTFGNQVSSILLEKPISVSAYRGKAAERVSVGGAVYPVFPTFYPVGQGQRNMPAAVRRIRGILARF